MSSTPMLLLSSLTAALAGPDGLVLATLETADAPYRFAELAGARGLSGPDLVMACRDLVPGELLLCLRIEETGGARRYLSAADLEARGVGLDALLSAAAAPAENPLREQAIEGGGRWWQIEAEPGYEASIFLHPEWLSAVGPNPTLCAPAAGVVMAWSAGDPELDMMMAVGARRAFESWPRPISPLCVSWTDKGWQPWGEAKPPAPAQ